MSFKYLSKLNPQLLTRSNNLFATSNPSPSLFIRSYRKKQLKNDAEKVVEDEYVYRTQSTITMQPEEPKRKVGRPKKSHFTTVATEVHEPEVNEKVETPLTAKENHKRARKFVDKLKSQSNKYEDKPLYSYFTGKGKITDSGFVF